MGLKRPLDDASDAWGVSFPKRPVYIAHISYPPPDRYLRRSTGKIPLHNFRLSRRPQRGSRILRHNPRKLTRTNEADSKASLPIWVPWNVALSAVTFGNPSILWGLSTEVGLLRQWYLTSCPLTRLEVDSPTITYLKGAP